MQYIFIHGLGQDLSSWDKVISLLPKPFDYLCPDLWHLRNNSEMTYSNLYQNFKGYCNNIAGPLNLCGLSLGAMLAMDYAIENPQRVQSLVLIGSQYKMPKGLLKLQNVLFRFMPNNAFAKMGMHKTDVIKLTSSMMDLDYGMELKKITCDTLVLCGANDNANKKAAMDIAKMVPKAEFQLVENAGHEVNTEAPVNLAATLAEFWRLSN